ncbi:MAG: hypothetical protein ACYDEA_05610 [Candidatus Dormibacteria bacterium]
MTEALDLGGGVRWEWASGDVEWFDTIGPLEAREDGRSYGCVGGILYHPLPDGSECGGAVSFGRPWPGKCSEMEAKRPVWTVNSLDPLDISPSVRCHCGFHGFIRAGRWVLA